MILRVFMMVLLVNYLFGQFSCSGTTPDNDVDLNVPYFAQERGNYCGPACIKMWAAFDGRTYTQTEIANYMGIVGSDFVSPYDLERAVSHYTNSSGYLARKNSTIPGAQGDLIAACITGIDNGIPSIMPYLSYHVVLIKGFRWKEDAYGKPVAIKVYYHDPNGMSGVIASATYLEQFFLPCPNDYWVIVGFSWLVDAGISAHNSFILSGGTYYGGPSYYDPKGLTPGPQLSQ